VSPLSTGFLPDRLRPRAPRRRTRWQVLAFALLPGVLALVPSWRVRAVEVEGCPALPASVRGSLATLAGTPVALLDLGWVRRQVEVWPGVASVEVRLDLTGALRVGTHASRVEGSVPVGRGWHGVAPDGALAGPMAEERQPVLAGFGHRPDELWRGLEVARRLGRETGGTVSLVREVTPGDCLVELVLPGGAAPVVVHVQPKATESERFWCRQVRAGARVAPWTDLRAERRLVVVPAAEPEAPTAGAAEEPGGGSP
jgi:hypothetical protein